MEDLYVPRAAAKVAGEGLANISFGWLRVSVEKIDGRHHHSRRTDSALSTAVLDERLLDRMKDPIYGRPLNCLYHRTLHLNRRHETAVDQGSIQQDGACTALAL